MKAIDVNQCAWSKSMRWKKIEGKRRTNDVKKFRARCGNFKIIFVKVQKFKN
jgi:hypothetical protein